MELENEMKKAGFLLDEKGKTSFFSSLFGFPVYSPIGIKMISQPKVEFNEVVV